MIKPKKQKPTPLASIQKNESEIRDSNAVQSPVEFYNKHIRKEGQRVLTEEEYKEFVKLGEADILLKDRKGNLIAGTFKK